MTAETNTDGLSTVLITGGTDGLGRATAIHLAEQGYRVFAASRSPEKRAALDQLAAERRLPLETVEMDVSASPSVDAGVVEIERRAGPVDVLVNSAGIAMMAALEEVTLNDLRYQFEVNYFGTVRAIQRVLPGMRARRRGRIVNFSSVAGRLTYPVFGPYSSSKFAVEAMSDALRMEVYPFDIHVAVIEPGYIPSGMERAAVGLATRYIANRDKSPYGRLYSALERVWKKATERPDGTPEDCARVVLRAIRDTPPRTRYRISRRVKMFLALRRVLSDRAMDRSIIRAFGLEQWRREDGQSKDRQR